MSRDFGRARVCYEGDGGAGGGSGIGDFFSNLFGSGATQTAPTQTSLSLGELNPSQIGALQDSVSTGGGGVSIPAGIDTGGAQPTEGLSIPLTGAINSAQSPFTVPTATTAPNAASLQSFEGPGAGAGAAPGPGGAATAAPASISPDDASRGIVPIGQSGTQTFGSGAGTITSQPAGQISMSDPSNPLAPGGTMPSAGSEIGAARLAGQEGTIQSVLAGGGQGGGTGGGGSTETSIDRFLADPTGKSFLKAAGANANILLPAAGLGYQALTAAKAPEGLDAIRASAAQTSQQSQLLQNYLTTGTLPPGLQAGLDSAKEAAKASIRARYANLPGSSSAMEQELANADQVSAGQAGQLAIQLFSQGMSEAQVSNQLYETILQQSLERDKELSGAVGNFATAMAGGGPSVKLSLA